MFSALMTIGSHPISSTEPGRLQVSAWSQALQARAWTVGHKRRRHDGFECEQTSGGQRLSSKKPTILDLTTTAFLGATLYSHLPCIYTP